MFASGSFGGVKTECDCYILRIFVARILRKAISTTFFGGKEKNNSQIIIIENHNSSFSIPYLAGWLADLFCVTPIILYHVGCDSILIGR